MRTYTNLTWPDDPYRTGQQLFPRPAPRLTAFALGCVGDTSRIEPSAAAIVYLPLHRTRALIVTAQTLTFGFHAASISTRAAGPALAQMADLRLLQACRHAAVLAGDMLADDLTTLRALAPNAALRGVTTAEQAWANRSRRARGRAAMVDCGLDLPTDPLLAEACQHTRISAGATSRALDMPTAPEQAAAWAAVAQALANALIAARHLGRCTWDGTLYADEIMSFSVWDCFPHPHAGRPGAADGGDTAADQLPESRRTAHGEPG
jgi:hypothetical protein